LIGAALAGMHLTVACPPGFEPAQAALTRASEIASVTGSRLAVVRNVNEAVAGADVVITDTWTSMGEEQEHDFRVQTFRPYQVNTALMEVAASDAIFLHCLPAHRGEEVTDEVMDGPQAVIYDEAENRMHAQKSLLTMVMG